MLSCEYETLSHMTVVSPRWVCGTQVNCFALYAPSGENGDVHAETQALLIDFGVETAPFSEEVIACLPPTVWEG